MTSILLIERSGDFRTELAKRHDLTVVTSGRQACTLSPSAYALIVLDTISLRTPGERIARALKNHFIGVPLVHLAPPQAGKSGALSPADVVLTAPVSMRKLHNLLLRLLAEQGGNDHLLQYGHFAVDIMRRVLIVNGTELPLTPKLARLLEVFLRNPGETLERQMLMKSVWHTEYLGDTRTLDVHVRWIRRAIEHDPSAPRYLITVRGVGYRFDMPPIAEAAAV
jgi:DNA-binding response OmpR family regulator